MLTKNDLKEVKNLLDEAVAQIIKALNEELEEIHRKELAAYA